MIVKEMLKNKGLCCTSTNLGVVEISEELTKEEIGELKEDLRRSGLELLEESPGILIEKIKSVVIEMVYYCEKFPRQDVAEYIALKLKQDYAYLAEIFAEVKGITIEQFIINHKIERIKELILYEDLSSDDIAEKLCYLSVSDLSQQFERFTGLTTSYFIELRLKRKEYQQNM